jgi:predicted glutamine amidotransferase
MCGIFGFTSFNSNLDINDYRDITKSFLLLSETRGKDATGIVSISNKEIRLFKKNVPPKKLVKCIEYNQLFKDTFKNNDKIDDNHSLTILGHSRMVTSGSDDNNYNNQPVLIQNSLIFHNGIFSNYDYVKEKFGYEPKYEVDTEFIAYFLDNRFNDKKDINLIFNELDEIFEGTASLCVVNKSLNCLLLYTNNASLYYTYIKQLKLFAFASEEFTLISLNKKLGINSPILQLQNKKVLKVNIDNYEKEEFIYSTDELKIIDYSSYTNYNKQNNSNVINNRTSEDLLFYDYDKLINIKRCKNCLLPNSFPKIEFSLNGVCNYCNQYKSFDIKGKAELQRLVSSYKNNSVLVPFSGGRDSCYGLHFIVNELGLKPITYTYDWGMVTDLARRNIARMCGKLGVENILVSADIKKKRSNIGKNVSAWLKNPQLGIVPLFMAGDKQFFKEVNLVKFKTGIKLNIWSSNRLENTDFKSMFVGIKTNPNKKGIDEINQSQHLQMLKYYMTNYLSNPSYLNSSLIDTVKAYYSYYFEKREGYTLLFDYIAWDEKTIEDTIINEYNWETAPDTKSTWRIGDGTAPFYNYIYLTVAGFSENDTFRSNQIREGMITREQGMELIMRDNAPRYESMKWYFDTIGVDMESALKVINNIPKLYEL